MLIRCEVFSLAAWAYLPHTSFSHFAGKPGDSLTVPICYHFARVSLIILDFFLPQWLKLKKLVCKPMTKDLEQV